VLTTFAAGPHTGGDRPAPALARWSGLTVQALCQVWCADKSSA